jgi:subtilase family serine protease
MSPSLEAHRGWAAALLAAVCFLLFSSPGFAQSEGRRLTQALDESKLVTLGGNTRPEANAANDRGAVADHFPLAHMLLQLRRSTQQEQALDGFIDQLHDPSSANFHDWITAKQFGEKYGVGREDLATITGWLESHGFTVGGVYPNRMTIDFSGTAGQVRAAFHTEIHHLDVNGAKHIANMSDPRIPTALAPAVTGIVSLNDFKPRAANRVRPAYTVAVNDTYIVAPADLATIYNFNPIYAAGYSGQGQTIVVLEDSDVYSADDWNTFRTAFGLAAAYPSGSFTQVHPAGNGTYNCSDPGVTYPDETEAILDAEWASAAAPSATIEVASCADTATPGQFIAFENLLSASGTPPAIVSLGYGQSETINGAFNAAINNLYQQAVTAGVSIFVAAGDSLGAFSDYGDGYATHGINVNGWASTPYNVAVGGTDFGDSFAGTNSTYWSSTNGTTYGSALSYIPEIAWNDSCASLLIAEWQDFNITYGANGFCSSGAGAQFLTVEGGSGGPSGCATGTASTPSVVSGSCAGYKKPSWQSVFGNPNDGVRDIPDISLFASNNAFSLASDEGEWGHYYVYCWSDPSQYSNHAASCTGPPETWTGGGGTSFAAPIMAGIQALINQYTGTRWGNPNPSYYALARKEYGTAGSTACNSSNGNTVGSSCVFYDVTLGDIDAPCTGSDNCYQPSGTYGVLSTSDTSYQPAFATTTGWDFATGIGSVNASNLIQSFYTAPAITSANQTAFAVGTAGSFTVTATGVPVSTLSESGTLPSGISFNTATGVLSGTPTLGTVGTYSIQFTASNGGSTNAVQSFTLTVNPETVTPIITSLSPSTTNAGVTNFTLTVNGSNFGQGATVLWNGSSRTTSFVSATQLTASITAADVASIGTANITVANPTNLGGIVSSAFEFAIDTAPSTSGYFTASSTNTTLSVNLGQSTTLPVTIAGTVSGANIAAACANLPAGASCSYGNGAVTISASMSTPTGTYPITVIFQATQQMTAQKSRQRAYLAASFGLTSLPLGFVWLGGNRRKTLRRCSIVVFALVLMLSAAGCGGGSAGGGSPSTTTTTTQSSLPVTLTVN